MNLIIHNHPKGNVAEFQSRELLSEVGDFLDLMANSGYQGADSSIIYKYNLPEEFFELKNGMAGEILQKFSNYRHKLAIVGDFSAYSSKSLKDFIRESNRTGRIIFVNSFDEALTTINA